jgi:hypothetical protein
MNKHFLFIFNVSLNRINTHIVINPTDKVRK